MAAEPGRPTGSQVRRLRALADPVRIAVLDSLTLKAASGTELAAELDQPVEQIRYQLRRLSDEGLIVVHGARPRRGTLERIFIADPARVANYESELVTAASSHARRAHQAALVRTIFREALEALRVGALHDCPHHTAARLLLTLDAEGYREVEAILTRLMTRMFAIREESLERLEDTGEEPRLALSALLHLQQS